MSMFTLNIHALLDGEKKEISVGEGLEDTFHLWEQQFKKFNKNPDVFDAFIAGYTIGNNAMLKEKVLRIKSTNRRIDKVFGGKNGNNFK